MVFREEVMHLFFHCEESYSLFSGDFSRGRFGGAGLQMYLLSLELAKDDSYKVYWIFENHPVDKLVYPKIEFRNPISPISRGIPGISRTINKQRIKMTYACEGIPILMSTMAHKAVRLRETTVTVAGKSVYRCASDADVTQPFGLSDAGSAEAIAAIVASDAVTVQNDFQKNTLLNVYGKESHIVPNGISLPAQPHTGQRDIILWVASALDVKQPWYFVDLAKRFPENKFVMLMPCQQKLIWEFVHRISKDVENLVLIGEQIPFEQTKSLFQQAKIFINTSFVEGFPNTFLQAAAYGAPIISLSVNPDNVLEHYGFGLCADGDFTEMYEQTRELLSDVNMMNTMRASGLVYSREKGDIRKSAIELKKILVSINEI